MKSAPEQFYAEQLQKHQSLLELARKRHRFYTIARLFAFVLIVVSWYIIGWQLLLAAVLVIEITVFIWLVNRWLDAKLEHEAQQIYIQLNHHELASLEGNWSNFVDGSQFKTGNHPYANDMDLFGPKSVYQYINRTVLPQGGKSLADTLAFGAQSVKTNQIMIEELSHHIDWAQSFIVESKVYLKNEDKQLSLDDLHQIDLGKSKLLVLRWILPIISLSAVVLYSFDFIGFFQFLLIAIVVLAIVGSQLKFTNSWMHALHNRTEKMNALLKQMQLFGELTFNSEPAKELQHQFFHAEGMSEGMQELISIRKKAEYRMNPLVGLLLNYFTAWDFHLLTRSQAWLTKYGKHLAAWEQRMADVEVWISGAIYKYNRVKTCFAQQNGDSIKMVALGHPFVPVNKMVTNDFELKEAESFLIITGPNMAGKSTYLRSVGFAIICANAGFPILADACSLPPMQLYSSMRTSDDLTSESSYFHAELTRLRFIMDAVESGNKTFIILDEILKGTNSKDKEMGSAGFLEKLNRLNAIGIIATHDLSLTELAHSNGSFRNVYFDSTITGEELFFDYQVREGICKNMNASFLLKKMNLVD